MPFKWETKLEMQMSHLLSFKCSYALDLSMRLKVLPDHLTGRMGGNRKVFFTFAPVLQEVQTLSSQWNLDIPSWDHGAI